MEKYVSKDNLQYNVGKTKDYIKACEQGNDLICSNCKKKAPLDNFIF